MGGGREEWWLSRVVSGGGGCGGFGVEGVKGDTLARRVIMQQPALDAAPEDVRTEARSRFDEIAAGLGGIPADSPFWASAQVSRLCLDVRGWSFFYTLDDRTLRVTEVRRN
jgi:hypothetical protein